MKTKKSIALLTVLCSLVLFLGFNPAESAAAAKQKYEEKFEKTVAISKDGKVDLRNISGDIEVKTWDKAEVRIDALKVSRASTLEKAKENAQKVTIEVNKEDGILRISTKYAKTRTKSLSVSVRYNLMIPAKASAKVKSISGDITLEKIGGKVEASTVSGNVDVMKADKGVKCSSVSGNVGAKNVLGDADLSTVSGNISLEQIRGSVEAESVSGNVKLIDVSEADVVKGKTLSGTVIYEGKIKSSGSYSLKVHSGDIKMRIPSDSAFDFEAETFSGSIHSDFEITISGKISKREIRGSVNGGGADITLKNFSGNIYLKKK